MPEQNAVDFTGTSYDTLETELSQMLGLKVFLVRGWSDAAFSQAETNLNFARTPEAFEEAKKHYARIKETMLASLRANIAARDFLIGADITDNELFALQQQQHITLRRSNAEPEHAVIVFDPVSTPSTPMYSLGIRSEETGETTEVFNIVSEAPLSTDKASADAALQWAFTGTFSNWWGSRTPYDEDALKTRDLVENFDLDIQDIRRYEALVKIRYALIHQDECKNMNRKNVPAFFGFAGLLSFQPGRAINARHYDRPFRELAQEASTLQDYGAKELGMKDEQFLTKIKLVEAVMNLVYMGLTPNNTFARLSHNYRVTEAEVNEINHDLRKDLEEKFKKDYRDTSLVSIVLDDWRILFPLFREFYEADKSTGVKRAYLDTIHDGLQRFFPTLTNAPVPDTSKDSPEPSCRVAKKTIALQAQAATPKLKKNNI